MVGRILSTPLGSVYITAKHNLIQSLHWNKPMFFPTQVQYPPRGSSQVFEALEEQLSQYFSGNLRSFNIPIKQSGTPFQKKVWSVISKIDYGFSMSYQEIAYEVGSPKASRAVGTACGANQISILIPCHRVLATNKKLGGYGGTLDRKKILLSLEKIIFKIN